MSEKKYCHARKPINPITPCAKNKYLNKDGTCNYENFCFEQVEEGGEIMGDILKIPEVGDYIRNIGTLVKTETIPPKPVEPEVDYIFEDTEAIYQLRFNGEIIKNLSGFNDFYGLGTGVKSAIKEAKEYTIQHKITKDSDIDVVVIKVTRQYRARPTHKVEYWDNKFVDFEPLDNYRSTRNLPEPVETLVWSSKNEIAY